MNATVRLALTLGAVGAALAGCSSAEPRTIATADPTPEELPDLALTLNSPHQASVSAERDREEPRVVLVAPFEEPTLTPEEKAKLGEYDFPYRLLPHPLPRPPHGRGVGGQYGGVDTKPRGADFKEIASRGTAGKNIGTGPAHWGDIGIGTFIANIFGGGPVPASAASGPEQWPDVGTGERSPRAKASPAKPE